MYDKNMRRKLRELSRLAAGRELRTALDELYDAFHRMEDGDMTPWDVSDRIHDFHEGIRKDIWKMYQGNHNDWMAARAVALGLVTREEAGDDVCAALERLIGTYGEVDG